MARVLVRDDDASPPVCGLTPAEIAAVRQRANLACLAMGIASMSHTPAEVAEAVSTPRPWGPWATLGLGLVVAAAFVLVQIVVAVIYLTVRFGANSNADASAMAATIETNGQFLALSTLATAVICTGLLVVFARARRAASARKYLQLTPVSRGVLLRWTVAMIVVAVGWDLMTSLLGRPVIPPFQRAAYASAGDPIVFWLALVVAAPVFEELFFRGFLLTGWRHSRLGASGAVLVTALLWASLHLQYDLYEIVGVFIFGLLLGAARVRSASTLTPLVMHMTLNLWALLETAIYVNTHINAL